MSIQEFAKALDAKRSGSGWTANCTNTGHNDTKRKMSIKEGDGGKILLYCHSKNCTFDSMVAGLPDEAKAILQGQPNTPSPAAKKTETDAEDETTLPIARALIQTAVRRKTWNKQIAPERYFRGRGITLPVPPALMLNTAAESERHTKPTGAPRKYPAIVAPIVDSAFKVIGAHVTWLSTDMSQKLAVKNSPARKIYGHAKGGFVVLGKAAPDTPLIVGEGIETVLSAMQLSGLPGIAALNTSGVMGCNPPPCSEVIIAADNDKSEAGLQAAEKLTVKLRWLGRKSRIVMPRTEGWDWNDVLVKRGEKAQEDWDHAYENATKVEGADIVTAIDKIDFMRITFPPVKMMVGNWLPHPGLAMIHALRGGGKTWLALAIGHAVANGQGLLGWQVPEAGRVLYVDGELPGARLQERLDRLERTSEGAFQILCRDVFQLHRMPMPDLNEEGGRRTLDRIIENAKPDLVILDSISTLVRSGKIENDADSWQVIQDYLIDHRSAGRTVLMIHHDNKTGSQRGTSKREDVLDSVIQLKQRELDDPAKDPNASYFDLTWPKHRDFYGKDAEPLFLRLALAEGKITWSHETLVSERERQVQKLLDQGLSQSDIAKELGVTKGRVSQIVAELKVKSAEPGQGG